MILFIYNKLHNQYGMYAYLISLYYALTFLFLGIHQTGFEVIAQCLMVWMLLSMSVGWTLGSSTAHPFKEKNYLYSHLGLTAVQIFLVLWEQWYDESHYTYHVHESFPGLLLVLLRLFLAGLFTHNLRTTMATERSSLRKNFYQSFSIVSENCFTCQTLLTLILQH